MDINDDGVDELILVYQTETSKIDNVKYHVELWRYDGNSAKKVTSRISWIGNNIPYFGGFSVCKYNGKYLLELTDNAGWENYYYGTKKDGSIGLVDKFIWKGDAMQGTGTIMVKRFLEMHTKIIIVNLIKTQHGMAFLRHQKMILLKKKFLKLKIN